MRASPSQNLFAIFLLISVIAALGVRLWASHQAGRLTGPNHVAASKDYLYVHVNRTLYRLDTSGELQEKVSLSSLGIEGPLSDIQVLNNGDLLLGDFLRRTLRHCTPRGVCRDIAPGTSIAIKKQFKFYLDESSRQLYVADTRRHRLLVQSFEGGEPEELTAPRALRFPNNIWVDEDGVVYVTDTNHHRIVGLRRERDTLEENGFALMATGGLVRAGHTWPIAFARGPAGKWWVLSADGHLQYADLIVYGPDGSPHRTVDLPANADPVFIVQFGDRLVVTDRRLFRLYQIDPQSDYVTDFGTAAVTGLLERLRERKHSYQNIATLAMIALIGLLMAAFVLGARVVANNQRRWRRNRPEGPLTLSPMSRFQEVYWLRFDPEAAMSVHKLKRQASLALAILSIATLAAIGILMACKVALTELKLLSLALIYLLVAISVLLFMSFRVLRHRIGADAERLYLADHSGRVLPVPPEEAVYTSRLVAFGPLAAPLKLGNGRALYSATDMEEFLKPLLHRAQQIGEVNMMIYQMLHRNALVLVSLVMVVLGLVIIFATGLSQALF
ncbi:MAG: hypothetical protein ACE5K1_03535 [Acidiferrobacterales bacterium]